MCTNFTHKISNVSKLGEPFTRGCLSGKYHSFALELFSFASVSIACCHFRRFSFFPCFLVFLTVSLLRTGIFNNHMITLLFSFGIFILRFSLRRVTNICCMWYVRWAGMLGSYPQEASTYGPTRGYSPQEALSTVTTPTSLSTAATALAQLHAAGNQVNFQVFCLALQRLPSSHDGTTQF